MTPESFLQAIMRAVGPHPARVPQPVTPQQAVSYGPPLAVMAVPFELRSLILALETAFDEKRIESPLYRFAFLVPAGSYGEVSLAIPGGHIGLVTEDWLVSSSRHLPGILLSVFVDGQNRLMPEGVPLANRDMPVRFGRHREITQDVIVAVTNNTAEDVTITVDPSIHIIEQSLYESFVQPLMAYSRRLMEQVLMLSTGGVVVL